MDEYQKQLEEERQRFEEEREAQEEFDKWAYPTNTPWWLWIDQDQKWIDKVSKDAD